MDWRIKVKIWFYKKIMGYFMIYNEITQYCLKIGFGKIHENYITTKIKKEQNITCQN